MLRIGLPAGIQSGMFSFSNVLIQSSINSFGSVVMAGSSASASIENFVYISMNGVHQATVSFVSQNNGAGKPERINKILFSCLGLVTVTGILMGGTANLFSRQLLSIYSTDPAVIRSECSGSPCRIFYAVSWKWSWVLCAALDTRSHPCWWLSPVPVCTGSSGLPPYLPGSRPSRYCTFAMPPLGS